MRVRAAAAAAFSFLLATVHGLATPVINEIMYRPAGAVENPAEEWIEIFNSSETTAFEMEGWQFTKGVSFTFPSGQLGPRECLVVAADVLAFEAAHPAFQGRVIGGWTGRLSNSGETLRLDDAAGQKLDEVTYADEGDWARRVRGPLSFQHRGWIWETAAAGGGSSLELRNPSLARFNSGQNWTASTSPGGTPGGINSLASSDVAPLIQSVKHRPLIPRAGDPIVISCTVRDESPGAEATLHWRLDGGAWQSLPMSPTAHESEVEAAIPPQAHLAVIEFHVSATDGVNSRTWPAPARTSEAGATPEVFAQVTNALLQVDNTFNPNLDYTQQANHPTYRLIMTAAERQELAIIGSTSGRQQSVATMNGTFISADGNGLKIVYNAGFRNRGFGSALGPPNNYHVSFRSDDLWNGRSSMALNCRFPHSQVLGNTLFELAGIPPQRAAIVQVRVNGANLALSTPTMYGRYARVEGRGGNWAERHFPDDPDGNFYRLDDHAPGPVGTPPGNLGRGEFRYEGTNPAAYSDTYIKDTNKEENDYSDLIELCRIVSAPITGGTAQQPMIPDSEYIARVSAVLDLDQVYRYLAIDALIGNQEGGLQSGRADDMSIYRGVYDTRFRFIPHDLDDIFDIGADIGNPLTRSIFSYDGANPGTGVLGLTRLFNHPELVPRYYSAVIDAMEAWFNRATIDPVIDRIMGGWVPATGGAASPNSSIQRIKEFINARRANVLGQIQQNYSLAVTGSTAPEGYVVTADGAVTFSGVFNVARTYSITVNGQLAQHFYRTGGGETAGTWRLITPAGGGAVLSPGLNRVQVRFWDSPGGAGNIVHELRADVLYDAAGAGVSMSGAISAPGLLTMLAPDSYVPGVPVLVRFDLKDEAGELKRSAWNTTVHLTATNGVALTPNVVTLFNGVGSALVSIAGAEGGSSVTLLGQGGTRANPAEDPPLWRMLDAGPEPDTAWRTLEFDDSDWTLGLLEAGAGDGDERTLLDNVPTNEPNTRRAFYFRKVITVSNPAAFMGLEIRAVVDDGAVFYLNGVEVQRDNMPAGPVEITTPASSNRAGTAEAQWRTFDISQHLALLRPGENILAVEVHNFSSSTANSVDLSFDCALIGITPASNPGDFAISGSSGGSAVQKQLASLGLVVPAEVSGALPGGVTAWSGVVRVTGDVTVPAGATLQIEPGAHVLVDGNAIPGSTVGRRIIVNGALHSLGTAERPVSITASNAADRWGQILFSNAQPATLSHTLISRAGRTTGVGHTGRGPMLRLAASNVSLLDSVLADAPAKAIYTSGACDLMIRRSLIERMITGPELGYGCALLLEDSNIQQILPHFRESNAPAPDDEDALYIHNGGATPRPVIIRRSVLARCGDDLLDCLGGPIVVEDSILREAWDKGISLLNNDLTIARTLIIDCDKAVVPKSSTAAIRTVNADRVTIVAKDHDQSQPPWGYTVAPASPDPDTASAGFYTQNKANQSHVGATMRINVRNSIVIAREPVKVDAPYSSAETVVNYSDLLLESGAPFLWPGAGNISEDPAFVATAGNDFRLTAASPARDAGDPAQLDPDGTRADMGALPYIDVPPAPATITWTAAGGPYRIIASTFVPVNAMLIIEAGAHVQFAQNAQLTVNGNIQVLGTEDRRVVFSHIPGEVAAADSDPIKLGVQTGPPKWGGLRIHDSMAAENVIRYADFINAQGTSPLGAENHGSLGFIRSWGRVEHCTWSGTHLRMLYGRNSKLAVRSCIFPDMFIFDPVLGRIENPADFLASADNNQEQLKVEYPTIDAQVTGNAAFVNGLPRDGWLRVYHNQFHGNRGHNDVFDADSGRWGVAGEFVLDCRYNQFHGITGDEHMDLGGDAYIASNVFERGTKDQWTSDTGYSSAISSGDRGAGTTLMVARNLFFDLDHALNLKTNTGAIFEHNTVANIHADYVYQGVSFGAPFTLNVKCAPVNFFIPEDGLNPTYGDGAYLGYNLISNAPRLFSGADARKSGGIVVNDITTKIEFFHNLLNQIGSTEIGPRHPGGIFNPAYGINTAGEPEFINPSAKNFALKPQSAALGSAPGGLDYGATAPEWAYIHGGPERVTTSARATFFIGGPGMVAYRWRLNRGAWSQPVQIGAGGVFPRNEPTVRQATLTLTNLTEGLHTLEVLGQDFAGNWQDADPARELEGVEQSAPAARIWKVAPAAELVRINEVLADSATEPDAVELYNASEEPVDLAGWSLTDNPAVLGKYIIPANTIIAAGGYLVIPSTASGLGLDKDGDAVYLYRELVLHDAVVFGPQVRGFTIGRREGGGEWTLCAPTLGAGNVPQRLGDSSAVRINEWFADGDARYDSDWIELYHPGPLPVSIAGLRITDNLHGRPMAHVFPPLSFMGAGGYLKLNADNRPDRGPAHLGFALDAHQEQISLLNADGSLLDTVIFGPQPTDFSQGRDENGNYVFYELPTAGFANGAGDPAYANALALLRGLRITELMYNAIGGNDFDYIELRNVGATPLQLGGVRFVEGIDFTFPQLTLAPGGEVLVVAHLARFRARYGAAPVVAGVYSGRLDNAGETLAIQLPRPFDANILTFTYNDAWVRSTDGFGPSLAILNPSANARTWGERDAWQASSGNGGDPGSALARRDTYSGWSAAFGVQSATEDADRDGLPALVEYGLGMNPLDGSGGDGAAGGPQLILNERGRMELHFLVPVNAGASFGHGMSEVTYTVQASNNLSSWSAIAAKSPASGWSGPAVVQIGPPLDGYVPVIVEDAVSLTTRRFLRLQVTWAP